MIINLKVHHKEIDTLNQLLNLVGLEELEVDRPIFYKCLNLDYIDYTVPIVIKDCPEEEYYDVKLSIGHLLDGILDVAKHNDAIVSMMKGLLKAFKEEDK